MAGEKKTSDYMGVQIPCNEWKESGDLSIIPVLQRPGQEIPWAIWIARLPKSSSFCVQVKDPAQYIRWEEIKEDTHVNIRPPQKHALTYMCTYAYGNMHKYIHNIHMQKPILKISLLVSTGLEYLLVTTLMSFPSLCSLWKWTGVLHGTYAGSKATWQGHQRWVRAQTRQRQSLKADPLVWRDSQLKRKT